MYTMNEREKKRKVKKFNKRKKKITFKNKSDGNDDR